MEHDPVRPGLKRTLAALAQVAFHDNAVKLVLIGLATAVLPPAETAGTVSLLALLLVLPFVLFGPLAGWLADRFPKDLIFRHALVAQVLLTLGVIGAVHSGHLGLAVACFFLLGLQSTFFSPAKRGILKELVGSRRLASATGAAESLVVLAILAGTLAGGWLFDHRAMASDSPWAGASSALWIFLGGCVAAWAVFLGVRGAAAADDAPFHASLLWGHTAQLRGLARQPGLFKAALGESAFYFLGGAVMVTLMQLAREQLAGALGTSSRTAVLMALMGGGIILGSLLAGLICRRALRLGLIPLGGLAMAASLWTMAGSVDHDRVFSAALILLGVSGGLFLVPISTYLQDRAKEEERGNVLAATNLLASLAGMAAVALQFVLASGLGLGVATQCALYGCVALGMAVYLVFLLPDELLRLAGLALARLIYPTRIVGAEHLPTTGGVLIVCNHVSYADVLPLALSCTRPIRFLSLDSLFKVPVLGVVLRIFGCIPVSPLKAKDALKKAADALAAGEVVCLFPEGQLTRTGCLMELKPGFELIARKAGCPVVAAHLDGLWGSIFSFSGGRYFWKWPRRFRVPITVSFAPPLAPEEATTARVRQTLLELGAEAFALRAEVRMGLGRALLHQLKARPWEIQLIDFAQKEQGKPVRRAALLTAALSLAFRWKNTLPGHRIGIVLPPGEAGTIANLALLFAGKVPVNLNPTASPAAIAHALASGEIATVLTAAPVRRKLAQFPWPEATLDLAAEAATLSPWAKARAFLQGWIIPYPLLKHRLPAHGGDDEAALLFTSGSSGLPKGVPLSHANLLANALQIRDIDLVRNGDRILSALPLFHSFGLTVGLLCPLLLRRVLLTAPTPLESDKIARAGRIGRATLLLGTPTFLRQWMKRLDPADLPALRLAVTGAEKLPAPLAQAFQEKYRALVLEGYGLTETSPVAAFNLPDPVQGPGARSSQSGHRPGSVGRLLPGLAARLLDPATGKPLHERNADILSAALDVPSSDAFPTSSPKNRQSSAPTAPDARAPIGLLAFRGANVLRGYLGGVEASKFQDGWFLTGDLARFDEEGFLFIEGRLSRFSKIGGEMVPHLAVEEALLKALPPDSDKPTDVILGLPDGEKGEELVLLTARALDLAQVRARLAEAGLPNLWVPKRLVPAEAIPVLGSGKLDFAACKELAEKSLLTTN
jgi:acyl-[acyl-carrier-protein]-phospholipid O-acyltransferase/long-chain-fatty-acid--[acyl-carrier-protein] ligase